MLNEGRSLSVRFLIGNPGMMLIHVPLVPPCIVLWPIIVCPLSMPDQALSASPAAVCSHLWCPVIHHSVFPIPYVENWACYICSLFYADPQWICSWGFSACLEGRHAYAHTCLAENAVVNTSSRNQEIWRLNWLGKAGDEESMVNHVIWNGM